MKAPFPWMGGKSRVADIVWSRFGADIGNYVEPFAGSLAVLLGRPDWDTATGGIETVNDADGLLCNAWRAILHDPDQTAHHADWPVNESDLHARHSWLVQHRAEVTARLEGDPDWHDPKLAGWWLWGIAQWIGSGWCSGQGPWVPVDGQLVHLGNAGQGVTRQLVHLGDAGRGEPGDGDHGLLEWIRALSHRLARVRVCVGDWTRVTGPTPTHGHGPTAIFLDPPYSTETDRDMNCYAIDSGTVAHDVRRWCETNGTNPLLRIALCGYTGEGHDTLTHDHGWTPIPWKAHGGYGNQSKDGRGAANAHRETIWFSPACLDPQTDTQLDLFGAS